MGLNFASFMPLFLAFQLKHFLCDFVFQTKWMAKEKASANIPLFLHSGTHSLGTLMIILYFAPSWWFLCLLDLVTHAAIDRARTWVRGTVNEKKFWVSLGADQMAHHIFHY